MLLFIFGMLLVAFGSTKAVSVVGAMLATAGMMLIIREERERAAKELMLHERFGRNSI